MTQPAPTVNALHDGTKPQRLAPARPARRRTRGAWLLGLGALLAAMFLAGYVPRQRQRARLATSAASLTAQPPRVSLVRPTRSSQARTLTLPASLQGLEETVLYARADGYVSALPVDLGDDVEAGDTLAELDNPEVDREIQQARASLGSSEAQLVRAHAAEEHSALNLRRYQEITPGLIAAEEIDEKRTQAALDQADVAVATAARTGSRANLARLRQLKAFSRVVAPFAGTITARFVERGALVSPGKDSPLFKLTSLHTLRALVQVPQSRVAGVATKQLARIDVAQYPLESFQGVVTRSAGALDSASRTMGVEIQVPNPQRKLLPGMYIRVTLELGAATPNLMLPATALVIDEHGTRVATVNDLGRVHLLPVVIERDHGAEVELASGLLGTERLIANPGPMIAEGSRVQVEQR